MSADLVMIQTLDFFSPIVDDPHTFGAIAAANSMSDIYAMGGSVSLALNIAAFPSDLPVEILVAILEGGAAKVAEAGGAVAGGHTVDDPEPKYGLCVTGFAHPDRVWTKGGATPGDTLVLTKPIGTGVVTTALKREAADPAHVRAAIDSMLTLNRAAAVAAGTVGPNACTDITGFGLLGHLAEMAEKGGVAFDVEAASVPLLPGARAYAAAGHRAGGLGRNRDHFATETGRVWVGAGVPEDLEALLWDPQTSGGLLLSVAADRLSAMMDAFREAGAGAWAIGSVSAGEGVTVR